MALTYLSRPVFDFPVNWRNQPVKQFTYDLREINLGAGAATHEATQAHVHRGIEFEIFLATETEIVAWEAFADQTKGRHIGFWFPDTLAAFEILDQPSGTSLTVKTQDLVSTLADHPSVHVVFQKRGQVPICCKILSVGTAGSDELLTFDTDLDATAFVNDGTWEAARLLYCRFTSDTEESEAEAETVLRVPLKVYELPNEYTAVETGLTPVYFYRFFYGGPGVAISASNDWFFTSFYTDVSSTYAGAMAAQVHTAKNLTHGRLTSSIKAEATGTTLKAYLEATNPLSYFVNQQINLPLWVEIRSASFATPNTTRLLFTGQVLRSSTAGRMQDVAVASIFDTLGKRFPAVLLQPQCNWTLYDLRTCKVVKASWAVAVTVTSVSGTSITLTGGGLAGKAANYFAQGFFTLGSGRTLQSHTIISSAAASGSTVVIKVAKVLSGITALSATAYPGCDLSRGPGGCAKFSNYLNHGGFAFMPNKNAVITPVAINNKSKNKK